MLRFSQPARVLLIEDDPDCHMMVDRWLEDDGRTVLHAYNGLAARALLQHARDLDIVLASSELKDVNALQVAQIAKAARPAAQVLIMVSVTDEKFEEARREFKVQYIQKPFTREELHQKVEELLVKKNKEEAAQ